jgi:MFS family permease
MHRDLKTLSISLFIWGLGESLFLFFQPIYLQQLGADSIEIGTIFAIMGFALGIVHIPIGHLSDQIGVKFILRTSWVLGTIATAMMALAPNISFYTFGMLIYVITGAVNAPMNSYISSIKGNLSIGRAISIPVGSFSFGAIIGPVLGGIISQMIGLRSIYWIAFCLFIVSSSLAFFLKEKEIFTGDKINVSNKPWHNKKFNLFLLLVFLLVFSAYLPIPLTANYLYNFHDIPLTSLGVMGALASIGYILLAFSVSHLKPEKNLILSIGLLILFCLMIYFGNSIFTFGVAYLFVSGYRFLRSMIVAYSHRLVHQHHLGLAFGLIESTAALGITLAPLTAGFIYALNPKLLYPSSSIILIIGLLITIYFTKTIEMKKQNSRKIIDAN